MSNIRTTLLAALSLLFSTAVMAQCTYFYADLKYGGPNENTDIFTVTLNGTDAELDLVVSANGLFHIAYDADNELLYLFHEKDSYFTTYDVNTGTFGPDIYTTPSLKKISQAVFTADSTLLVGDQTKGAVYEIDLNTGAATLWASDRNINDGDLVLGDNGELFMTSNKSYSHLRSIAAGGASTFVGRLPENLVNGSALTPDGTLLCSFGNSYSFIEIDPTDGSAIGAAYNATYQGQPYRLNYDGDMASGCATITPPPPPPPAPDCEFAYYLSKNIVTSGSITSELYGVELNGTFADLTLLETFNYSIHIAMADNGMLFLVGNGSNAHVQSYDPLTGTFGPLVSLPIGNLPQAVYHDGTLYVASGADNTVYTVDYPAGTVTAVGTALAGTGDLVFTASGDLWSVSPANDLTLVSLNGGSNSTLGHISGSSVVGLALTDTDEILVSQNGSSQLKVLDSTGAATGTTYTLKLNGATFTQQKGDLASACVPTVAPCSEVYFLSRNVGSDSEVYGVELNGTDAELTLLTTFNSAVHLAFNESTSELYMVSNTNPATVSTYNTLTAALSAPVTITGVSGVVQMVYDNITGTLYIGSQTSNEIYSVDPATGVTTFVATASVSGGDLVLTTSSGDLLNTSNGTHQFALISGGTSTPLSSFSGTLVGLAATPDSNILASFNGATTLSLLDETGAATGTSYNLMLNGASFTQANGDLAGGCGAFVAPNAKTDATISNTFKAELSIYPNPATDMVTVDYLATSDKNEVQVMVFNTMGQQVYSSSNMGSVKANIDASSLQTGMYIVIVKENGASASTSKLIIK